MLLLLDYLKGMTLLIGKYSSSHLPVKPFADDNDCMRIGKGYPRRRLVSLRSETAPIKLLSLARRLRSADQYTAAHIYINADLTPG